MKRYIFIIILSCIASIVVSKIAVHSSKVNSKLSEEGCDCVKYDCACCQFLEWDIVGLNGSLCLNMSYLPHDYGISLVLAYNDEIIIDESISVRNPPPICIGQEILELLNIDFCLRIYDIDVDKLKFHACFRLEAKVEKIKISTINLGCMNVGKKFVGKIGNNIPWEPSVIMV